MRIVLVVIIWIVIVGGLWAYVWQRDAAVVNTIAEKPIVELAEQSYSLEITPTFSTEVDPFALDTSDANTETLEVRLNGNQIPVTGIQLERGLTRTIPTLDGVVKGHNEIYLKASPPLSQHTLNHGIRIRLFENDSPIADHTLWNSRGSLVSGTVSFEIGSVQEDDHDH